MANISLFGSNRIQLLLYSTVLLPIYYNVVQPVKSLNCPLAFPIEAYNSLLY